MVMKNMMMTMMIMKPRILQIVIIFSFFRFQAKLK